MLTPDRPRHGYMMRDLQRCAEREACRRFKVYKNRVLTGRMTQHDAEIEIDKMEAIAAHFAELAEKERLL
jgi:hypothetical protein